MLVTEISISRPFSNPHKKYEVTHIKLTANLAHNDVLEDVYKRLWDKAEELYFGKQVTSESSTNSPISNIETEDTPF